MSDDWIESICVGVLTSCVVIGVIAIMLAFAIYLPGKQEVEPSPERVILYQYNQIGIRIVCNEYAEHE